MTEQHGLAMRDAAARVPDLAAALVTAVNAARACRDDARSVQAASRRVQAAALALSEAVGNVRDTRGDWEAARLVALVVDR